MAAERRRRFVALPDAPDTCTTCNEEIENHGGDGACPTIYRCSLPTDERRIAGWSMVLTKDNGEPWRVKGPFASRREALDAAHVFIGDVRSRAGHVFVLPIEVMPVGK